jgi:hypothetical protein
MERRFTVEAKTFFSTKASQIRLEERRKGFLGLILVDRRCAAWLAETVEEVSQLPVVVDFDKASSEGRKLLSVRGGCNKGGRFLEMVACVDDDRKGIIWIPEARSGRGWWRLVSELRSWLAALDSVPGSASEGSIPEERSSGSLQAVEAGRSYAEVLRLPPREAVVSVGRKFISSQEVDFLPMANRVEVVVRAAWDCYEEWECGTPVALPGKVADLGRRKKKMHLGLLCLGLGLGKWGLGLPGLGAGSIGLDSGIVSGLVGPVS